MTIQAARVFVGQSQGLPSSFDGSGSAYAALTQAEQISLTRGLINYILANPGNFSDAQVATARAEAGRAGTLTAQDTSYDWSQFVDTALERGNSIIGSVGFSLTTALILGVVVFAGIYAFQLGKAKA